MSIQQTLANQELPRSNILAVTGLSRRSLAAMYRSNGLFGRDSALTAVEQAVVQSRLPQLAGLVAPNAPAILDGRLKRLADYVDALVTGGEATAERQRLQAEGYAQSVIGEAAITVDNVRVVFGNAPAAVGVVTARGVEAPRYARAA